MQLSMMAALSHAPGWDLRFDHRGPGERFVAAAGEVGRQVAAASPDAIVVFGPDHFRNFFFDLMPAFCIGVEAVEGFGDFGTLGGPLPIDPALGRFVAEHVREAGFDPAISLRMGVDHGIVQTYQALVGDRAVPLVPIMINCSGAGMPSLRRCHAFGEAVGRALRACPGDARVAVAGSGGLSHAPPSLSPYAEATSADVRDYLINGRPRAVANSAARDEQALAMRRGEVRGPVNEAWDRAFLEHAAEGDLEPVLRLSDAEVEAEAGPGAHEIRCWLAALGAWGGGAETIAYEPVPGWITGMGAISAVASEFASRPGATT